MAEWVRPVAVCALVLIFMVAEDAWGQPADGDVTDPGDLAEAEGYFARQLRDARVPGGAFVVVRGDEVVHAFGVGRADEEGTPVTPDTPFVIGSVSKSFTALAVMQLVNEGAVELDAPVRRYLPWFRVADEQASEALTVRQMLNQTSGLSRASGVSPLYSEEVTLSEQVRALSSAEVGAPPSPFSYSNSNYQVLGAVVEAVSSQPFGDYVRDRIFGPLEMDRSFVTLPEAQDAGLSDGHRLFFGVSTGGRPFFRSDFLPAASLVTSAEDLGHYVAAQLNGGTYRGRSIVSADAVALMHQGVADVVGPGSTRYGMGWYSGERRGVPALWHSGSNGDQQAVVILQPTDELGVAVLFNATSTLYEFFQKPDAIAWGVASILSDRPPSGTLERMYPAFIAVTVIVTGLQIRRIMLLAGRVPAKRRRFALPLGPRARAILPWLGVLVSLLAGITLLIGFPSLLATPWTILVQTDLGLWVFVFAVLELIAAALRLRNLLQRHGTEGSTPNRHSGPMPTAPSPEVTPGAAAS